MRGRRSKVYGFPAAILLSVLLVACGGSSTPAPTSTAMQTTVENTPASQRLSHETPEGRSVSDDSDETPAPMQTQTAAPPTQTPSMQTQTVAPPTQAPSQGAVNGSGTVACPEVDGPNMSLEEYKQALACVQPRFPWPEGYRLDIERVNSVLDQNAEVRVYPLGYEYMFVGIWNMCSWGQAWLDARTESNIEMEQIALQTLSTVILDYPTHVEGFPPTIFDPGLIGALTAYVEGASLGDPSGIQEFVTYSCHLGYVIRS